MPEWVPDILQPGEQIAEFIRDWLNQLGTDLVTGGMELIGDVITAPIDLSERVPNFNEFIIGTQVIGGLMLTLFLYQKVLGAMYNQTIDAEEVSYAKIIGDTAIGAGLIYSLPLLANRFGMIAAQLTDWVSEFAIEIEVGSDLFGTFLPGPGDLVAVGLHMILLFVVWGAAFLLLAISGGVRVAIFALGVIISPLVMAAYPVNPGLVRNFLMSLVAIILAQPYQMLCLSLGMGVAAMGGFWGLLGSLAFICLGIWPPFLKNLISSTGVSTGTTGAAKMALYKIMRR